MGRTKVEKTANERFAKLKSSGFKKEVRAWQYYSVYDFCRSNGATRAKSEEIARWCRDKAVGGDKYNGERFTIEIVEREVVA